MIIPNLLGDWPPHKISLSTNRGFKNTQLNVANLKGLAGYGMPELGGCSSPYADQVIEWIVSSGVEKACPLVICYIAIENTPSPVDLPIQNGDLPIQNGDFI